MIVVYLAVFALPIVAGCVVGVAVWWCERRRLAAGFAHGRALNTMRLPTPVEPMPVLRVEAA